MKRNTPSYLRASRESLFLGSSSSSSSSSVLLATMRASGFPAVVAVVKARVEDALPTFKTGSMNELRRWTDVMLDVVWTLHLLYATVGAAAVFESSKFDAVAATHELVGLMEALGRAPSDVGIRDDWRSVDLDLLAPAMQVAAKRWKGDRDVVALIPVVLSRAMLAVRTRGHWSRETMGACAAALRSVLADVGLAPCIALCDAARLPSLNAVLQSLGIGRFVVRAGDIAGPAVGHDARRFMLELLAGSCVLAGVPTRSDPDYDTPKFNAHVAGFVDVLEQRFDLCDEKARLGLARRIIEHAASSASLDETQLALVREVARLNAAVRKDECPICFEVCRQVRICENNHSVCRECRRAMGAAAKKRSCAPTCPICRQPCLTA